ncbi:MAG: hypothetical protein AAGB31_05135 [Bdellovibrio sp.]
MEQFRSSRVHFLEDGASVATGNPGRYPFLLNFLFETVLSWSPQATPHTLSRECSSEVWQQRIQDSRIRRSPSLQGAVVQKYIQDCQGELRTGPVGSWSNLLKMMTMKYSPQKHPFLSHVLFDLPGNIKLKGLLALKGDMKRRPLVILRLGIFSNVEDFKPERAWLMMLFEQMPFNVLVLENMSSSDFITNNSQFSFGGYDEGIQNILISRLLTHPDEPLSRIVDTVHLFGVSLGGHGVLFASLLNKYNSAINERSFIRSYTALCPVIDLQKTMQNLTRGGVGSAVVDLWSRQRLAGLEEKVPSVSTYERFSFLSHAIEEIARTYRGGLSYNSTVHLPPFMEDGSDFWRLNDFWSFYKNVEQPVFIYSTPKDPAVPYALNSQRLQNKEIKIESKNIRVIEVPEGVHCTLPVPYDWNAMASIFEATILSHSAGFKTIERSLQVDLFDEEWVGFIDAGSRVRFTARKPAPEAGYAPVEIEVTNSQGKSRTMNLSLPLSQFDFRFLNSELTESEQEMIVRWVNYNLKVHLVPGASGKYSLKALWHVAP